MDHDAIAQVLIDSAMRVHTRLGPGLLEGAYEACLVHELIKRGAVVAQQIPLPIEYDELKLEVGYRLDLVIEHKVVVELKAIDKLLPIHTAQLLSYLRLGRYQLGFLLNFNTVHLREGIKRVVNRYKANVFDFPPRPPRPPR
jgi:GxxExxY protein